MPPVRVAPGGELPGNMIYFKVLSDSPGPLTLRTEDGEPVAASIRTIGNDLVFAPDAPVAEGTQLVLEYTLDCQGLSDNVTDGEFAFRAGPHGAVELRAGELIVQEQGTVEPGRDGQRGVVRVRYYDPDANGLARGLMSTSFSVDGQPVWLTEVNGVPLVEVATGCWPVTESPLINTCGILERVPAGVHTVLAMTTIVGQTVQPEPVTLQVEVSCPEAESDDDPGPVLNPDETGAGEADDLAFGFGNDTRAFDDTPPQLTPNEVPNVTPSGSSPQASAASGCALSHTRSNAAGAVLGVLALATVARRRRRAAR